MYLFGLDWQNDSRVARIFCKRWWDGCVGSRIIRTVFRAERMQISRCGSLRETLLDEDDRLSNGDWKIVRADSRSPVA